MLEALQEIGNSIQVNAVLPNGYRGGAWAMRPAPMMLDLSVALRHLVAGADLDWRGFVCRGAIAELTVVIATPRPEAAIGLEGDGD
jgi:hypothetical protein